MFLFLLIDTVFLIIAILTFSADYVPDLFSTSLSLD